MRILLLLLVPSLSMAQPRKAVIYARQVGFPLNDSVNTWLQAEPSSGVVLIGGEIMTINNQQYSIDSVQVRQDNEFTFYMYQLSLKKKRYTCIVYPSAERGAWELYLRSGPSLTLYRVKENR